MPQFDFKSVTPVTLKKVLVIHTWGIGDWICFTPALRALRENYPGVEVDVLVGTPGTAPIVAYYDVRVIGVVDVRKSAWRVVAFLLRNFHRHYDAAVFTAGIDSLKADVAAAFIRADTIAVLTTRPDHRPRFIQRWAPFEEFKHRSTNNLALVELLGAHIETEPEPFLPLQGMPQSRAGSLLIHPGCDSANLYRRWPVNRFVAVAREILEMGREVGVILGPSERDLKPCFAELEQHPLFRIYADLPLADALRIIARHEVLLHSDSGLGHVAAALGRKSVAIFGPGNHAATRPIGADARVIKIGATLTCQPCIRRGGRYGCDERPCLEGISTEAVVKEVSAALGSN